MTKRRLMLPRFNCVTHAIAASGNGKVHAAGGGQHTTGPLIDIDFLWFLCEEAPDEEPIPTTKPIDCRTCLRFFEKRTLRLNSEGYELTEIDTCDCARWWENANPGRDRDWNAPHYLPPYAAEVFNVGEQTHGMACDGAGSVHVVTPVVHQLTEHIDAERLEPLCGLDDETVFRLSSRPVNCGACCARLGHGRSLYDACGCLIYGATWGDYL